MAIKKSFADIEQGLFALQEVFRKKDEVLSVYLFGSVAEGVPNRHSDVDIAVRLAPGLGTEEKLGIRIDLIGELENLIESEVDIVILDDASLKMIYQVFRHGRLLYAKNHLREESFRLKKQKEYFDFQYYIEKDRRELRAFYGH